VGERAAANSRGRGGGDGLSPLTVGLLMYLIIAGAMLPWVAVYAVSVAFWGESVLAGVACLLAGFFTMLMFFRWTLGTWR